MYYDVIMAGFGGQGIQTISQPVAFGSIEKGLEVSFLPSYGGEKRGGRTNVTIVISDEEIRSPITNHPLSVIAMDTISLEKFQPQIAEKGLLISNSSLIPENLINRGDITTLSVHCNDEALNLGNPKLANMIALGAFITLTDFLSLDEIEAVMERVIPERLKETIPMNLKALQRGIEIAKGYEY